MKRLKIINGKALTRHRIIPDCYLVIENGKIIDIGQGDIDTAGADVLDAQGCYLSPGFIDLHIHRGGGHDFMDNTVDAHLPIAETHARYGTTAMYPTSPTAEKENLENLLATLACYDQANSQNHKGAQFVGLHLEGPYFEFSQRGAQNPKYIRNPDSEEYQEILASSPHICRWSAAPELPGALEFGRCMQAHGILAAVAYTDAIYEDVVAAVENGYSLATPLYSDMSGGLSS